MKIQDIKISEKVILSLKEATLFSGVGEATLLRLAQKSDCPFVLWVGSKKFYKRRRLQEFLENSDFIQWKVR